MKYCSRCKTKTGPFVKYSYDKKFDNQYYHCRECNRKRLKKYRDKNKEKISEIVMRYEKKNSDKREAWNKAKSIPMKPCYKCGSEDHVDRHHPDYSKPHEVMFLCRAQAQAYS